MSTRKLNKLIDELLAQIDVPEGKNVKANLSEVYNQAATAYDAGNDLAIAKKKVKELLRMTLSTAKVIEYLEDKLAKAEQVQWYNTRRSDNDLVTVYKMDDKYFDQQFNEIKEAGPRCPADFQGYPYFANREDLLKWRIRQATFKLNYNPTSGDAKDRVRYAEQKYKEFLSASTKPTPKIDSHLTAAFRSNGDLGWTSVPADGGQYTVQMDANDIVRPVFTGRFR